MFVARMHLLLLLGSTSLACACSEAARLKVKGETPYVRCLAADPPGDRSWKVGRLALKTRARVLTIQADHPLQLAVFGGPAFAGPLTASDVEKLARSPAQVFVLLGGIGEDDEAASATLTALAKLERPVLVIAGGRDTLARFDTAFDSLRGAAVDCIVNATGLRELRIGDESFAILAGADAGRYATSDTSCGFVPEELDELADELPARDRWLLSWHAPRGWHARTDEGLDVGSAALSAFAARIGATRGLYAFPEVQAGRIREGATGAVAPRLRGGLERADGSLSPQGFLLVDLATEAISIVPGHTSSASAAR